MSNNWRQVLFSDEKTLCLAPDHPSVAGAQQALTDKTRHPPKLHVWGSAGSRFTSQLYFLTQKMDALLYQKIFSVKLQERHLIYSHSCPLKRREMGIVTG